MLSFVLIFNVYLYFMAILPAYMSVYHAACLYVCIPCVYLVPAVLGPLELGLKELHSSM